MKLLVFSVVVSVVLAWIGHGFRTGETGALADSGEQIYVSEGCIHCHSQYSRPQANDGELYGPASPLPSGDGSTVLIGNRRQGPDLSNIGFRRSREWNRIHLVDPAGVSPGSRMPSYRHLFAGDGKRGEALLDYLQVLVTEDVEGWLSIVDSWEPERGLDGNFSRGQALFGESCAQCHGELGDGDGPLASRFGPRPRSLAGGTLLYVPIAMDDEWRRVRLARIVKYGIAGTSMPGHEYLTDGEIVDLVAFVLRIEAK